MTNPAESLTQPASNSPYFSVHLFTSLFAQHWETTVEEQLIHSVLVSNKNIKKSLLILRFIQWL